MANTHSPGPSLLRLPPELIDHLLDYVPARDLQYTTHILHQVFPDFGLAERFLWRHVVIGRKEQLSPLLKAVKVGRGRRLPLRSFSMESYAGDADVLISVLNYLPEIEILNLHLGTNVNPEHLEEMFTTPRLGLKHLELHFRIWLSHASYYQFLKGSYFDTAIESLYRHWPEIPSFTNLSIVQDLPPRSTVPPAAVKSNTASLANSLIDISLDPSTSDSDRASGRSTPPTSVSSESPVEPRGYSGHGPFPYLTEKMNYIKPKHFAQPIVFFDIKCLARFGMSPVAVNLTHLRLRVPSRDLAYVLVGPQGAYGRPTGLFPSLRYLDISTTNVRLDPVLSALLRSYARLEHLVLDRVNLFGFTAREKGAELCKDLGGVCLSVGLARGKDRERQIAAWELADRTRMAQAEAERQRSTARTRVDDEEDESGSSADEETLAAIQAAEVAEAEKQQQLAIFRARRGHRSAGHSTFSLRDRPLRNRTTASSSAAAASLSVPPADRLYLVLPPLPTLKTVSIGGEAHTLPSAKVAEWENEFHTGWREGLAKVQGWAVHVADRYDRAKRKAEDWHVQEMKLASAGGKGKIKSTPVGTKPPTDIRLFRFPLPDEPRERDDPSDLTAGLIEVHLDGRQYLEPYKLAIADADLYANNHSLPPPCVLCTVPDCEGPTRRGAEGERVDGRGGMDGNHREGCGHLRGRKTWGWGAV